MIKEANTLFPGVKPMKDRMKWRFIITAAILLLPPVIRWITSVLMRTRAVPSRKYLEVIFASLAIQIQLAYIFFMFFTTSIGWKYYDSLGHMYFLCSLCLVAIIFGISEFVAYFNIYETSFRAKRYIEIKPSNVSFFPAIFSVIFGLIILERILSYNI